MIITPLHIKNKLRDFIAPIIGYMRPVLCVVLLLALTSTNASADHVLGSDITYKCTGTPGIFEVTFVFYRACSGIPVCPNNCGAPCTRTLQIQGADPSCSSSTFGSVSMSLVSVRDVNIDLDCPTSKNTCTNMGCVTAGTYTPGVERYEFKGFANIGPTSGIPASCCNVRFVFSECCRNAEISTGATWQNFYMDAIVNRCHSVTPCNSSPELTNDPFAIICGGDNYVFNNGAIDPDLDSLSYSFTPALQGFGSSVTYTPPFAFDRPMPWTGNATGAFPAGIHCDPNNGDIMFTPPSASANLFAGVMAIEIKQWKLVLINGVPTMTVVGITRRDIQMVVRGDCLPNNPPRLITDPPEGGNVNVPKTNWSICAGDQLCFTITAKDTDFNPPTVSDTTYLSWNAALASYGATFKPAYDPLKRKLPDSLGGGPREDRYQFCWTPDDSKASTTPYYFTVSAKDKRCPNPGRITRAFSVLVIGKANLKINKTNLKCGKWGFSYTNLTPKFVPKLTQWQISRVPGDQSMSNNPYVYNNTANPPNIQFTQGGRYYIQLKAVTDGPIGSAGCEKIITDSFDVDSVTSIQKRDTLACLGSSVQLSVSVKHGTPVYTYRWYNSVKDTGVAPLNGSSVSTSTFSVTPTATRYYTIQVRDLNGCRALDSLKVEVKNLPVGLLPVSDRICFEDTFVLDPGNNGGNIKSYLWNVGDTTRTIWKTDSGQYIVTLTDTFNCAQKDTMMLYVNRKVVPDLGADKAICEGNSVTLKATGGYQYSWRSLNGTPVVNVPKGKSDTLKITPTNTTTPTRYEVKAYLSYPDTVFKECSNTDTISVTVNALPKLKRPGVSPTCFTEPTAFLNPFFLDPSQSPSQNAGTGAWSYPADPAALIAGPQVILNKLKNIPPKDTMIWYDNWIRYTFTGPTNLGGCVTVDSAIVRVYGTPPTNAGTDLTRCDIAGVYEITKVHPYSPKNVLHQWEHWMGPGVDSTMVAGERFFTFNPNGPGVVKLPAQNTLTYMYGKDYSTMDPGLGPKCYKADQVLVGVTAAPKIEVSNDILVCADEPTFVINTKTDSKITPSTITTTYWEPATAADAALKGTGLIGSQSFNAAAAAAALPLGATSTNRSYLMYYKDTSTGCIVKDSIRIVIARVPKVDLTYDNVGADSPYVCLNTKSVMFRMSSTIPQGGTGTPPRPNSGITYSVTPSTATGAFAPNPSSPTEHLFNTTDGTVTPGVYWIKTSYTNNQAAGSGFNPPLNLKVAYTGCSAADSQRLEVQAPPVIAVASPSAMCSYDSIATVSLTQVPIANYRFQWIKDASADGAYTDEFGNPTTYKPGPADKLAGMVIIKATSLKDTTLSKDGKTNGDQCPVVESSQVLNIYPAPTAIIIPIDAEGCVPFTGNYAAAATGVSNAEFNWSWNGIPDADTDSLISKVVSDYEAEVDGKYSLGLTVKSTYGTTVCSATAIPEMMITHPLPKARFTAEPPFTTIAKPFFNFINQSSVVDGSAMSYIWNLGPGPDIKKPEDRIVTDMNPTNIEYAADTSWQIVTLKVTTEFGCADSTIDSVKIEPDITIFIPNAFRPYSSETDKNTHVPCVDGTPDCNQYFRVMANGQLSIEVFIYNRWGQLVFRTTDPNGYWNGTVMNNDRDICPQDVYVYQVNATSFSGKAYKYSGSITLLR